MVDISVWITTYNHERFIAEAIESVLRQQTSFNYEIIIGEDYSTDDTRAIVLRYQSQYPDKIRLLLPTSNLGMVSMTKATYALCTGRYVAWLDGDDYWTDPLKLQKQVDFLEAHPKFSMCFHKVLLLNQTEKSAIESIDPIYKEVDDTLSTKHFIYKYNPAYALSVVHRNVLGQPLPDWLWTLPYPDWGLYLILSRHGPAKYLSQLMGVYRVHKGGAYSGQTVNYNYRKIIAFFTGIKNTRLINDQFSTEVNAVISYYRQELFKENKELLKHNLRFLQLREVIKTAFLLVFKS